MNFFTEGHGGGSKSDHQGAGVSPRQSGSGITNYVTGAQMQVLALPNTNVDALVEQITVLRRAMYQGVCKGHRSASNFTRPLQYAAEELTYLQDPKCRMGRDEVIARVQAYLMDSLTLGNLLLGSDEHRRGRWEDAARQITELRDAIGDLPLSHSQSMPTGITAAIA